MRYDFTMCLSIAVESPECVLAEGRHVGHDWVVTHNRFGSRCGYVRVEPGHPWYGLDYDDVECDVHGGLTFAEADVACDGDGDDSGWWVGFDCGHVGDARDPALLRLTAEGRSFATTMIMAGIADYPGDTVRTQAFVERECRGLCEQASAALRVK